MFKKSFSFKNLIVTATLTIPSLCFSSVWNCSNPDGLKASISFIAEETAGSRVILEKIYVTFQKSDTVNYTIVINTGEIFDSLKEIDAFIEKESGASFSYITTNSSDDSRDGLPSHFVYPEYFINFSGSRNELLVVNLRRSEEFVFNNCKKKP